MYYIEFYTWDRVKDEPKFQIELNQYEKGILDFLEKNPTGFNKLQIIEGAKINKNTVGKYLVTLLDYDLIEVIELKQGETCYFPKLKNLQSFDQLHIGIKQDFHDRKLIIRNSIKLLENCPLEQVISVYSNCIHLIFSLDKIVKFSISSNKQKNPVKLWTELEKEIQEFLDEITTGINDILYKSVLVDIVKKDEDILFELEFFIKSKNQKSLE